MKCVWCARDRTSQMRVVCTNPKEREDVQVMTYMVRCCRRNRSVVNLVEKERRKVCAYATEREKSGERVYVKRGERKGSSARSVVKMTRKRWKGTA